MLSSTSLIDKSEPVMKQLAPKTPEKEALMETKMYILAKLHDEISGQGYQCAMKKVKYILTETLFGEKYPPILSEEKLKVDSDTCWHMINNKICDSRPFKCSNNLCITIKPTLNDKYSWWQSKIIEFTECRFKKLQINAENKNSSLFAVNCKVDHEKCEIEDSLIVWKMDQIVHSCPYEIIDEQGFQRYEGNIMQGIRTPIAFEIQKN